MTRVHPASRAFGSPVVLSLLAVACGVYVEADARTVIGVALVMFVVGLIVNAALTRIEQGPRVDGALRISWPWHCRAFNLEARAGAALDFESLRELRERHEDCEGCKHAHRRWVGDA